MHSHGVKIVTNNDISWAKLKLNQTLKGVSLIKKTEEFILVGDVACIPGFSSDEPEISVFINGEWVSFRDPSASLNPLAEIDNNVVHIENIFKEAQAQDPKLATMISFFLLGTASQEDYASAFSPPKASMSEHNITKSLTKEDIQMLLNRGIIRAGKGNFMLKNFKVDKKGGRESRLITNGRYVNEHFNMFSDERMEIPDLLYVLDLGLKFKIIWSIDANSYFYQFALKGPPASWFPFKTQQQLGKYDNFSYFQMNRLPMGFKLAPIIAQRISNLVTTKVNNRILKENMEGKTVAWVDNFIVFAGNERDAQKIMSWIQGQLTFFRIKVKEVDKSGEFLGLKKSQNGSLQFQEEWKEKTSLKIMEALEKSVQRKSLQKLLGRIIWLNYTIARAPLAKFPLTLQLAREIATNVNGSIQLNSGQRKELLTWKSLLDKQLFMKPKIDLKIAWSDATPYKIAVIIGDLIYTTSSYRPISIAIAESIGAGWAYLLAEQAAHLIVDNTTAGYAFAKGHCKEDNINNIINNVVEIDPRGSISWIESAKQLADRPTRNQPLLPSDNTRDMSSSQILHSNFFRDLP